MLKKMRMLFDRRGAGRADMDAQTTDRLVSAVVEGDTAPTAESAGGTADAEVRETLRLIASIRQIGASDTPLPESSVDAIMGALEREARAVPRERPWREGLGMVSGFLACAVTLGSGLLLVGGSGYLQPPDATATPVLAAAVASLAALASVLVHSRRRLRQPILSLLMLVTLGTGACAPTLPDTATVEVEIEIDPSALTTFHEGAELWGVRDIIESGDVIWVLTGATPFLRAYDRSGRMRADFGRSGQGPGELRNPWILSAATSAGEVVAWDLATRRRSVFDATGTFVSSTPTAIARESVRANIRSVTFGDPFRIVEDNTGAWTASYPGGISRGDDFWKGGIVRYAHGDAEPVVVVDFSVDLPGAASRVPAMGLGPVPLWDGCADGVAAVLDPVDRSLHLYRPTGTKDRQIALPWTGRPLSYEERLGYVRAMMRHETQGTNVADDEIERAAADMLAGAGDHLAAEAPLGVDLRCAPGRIWIQEFDRSSHPLGYGRTWMTVAFDDAAPRFQKVVFPDGFTPYRLTDSVAIGVVTDSTELQRVAVVRLATVPPEPMPTLAGR